MKSRCRQCSDLDANRPSLLFGSYAGLEACFIGRYSGDYGYPQTPNPLEVSGLAETMTEGQISKAEWNTYGSMLAASEFGGSIAGGSLLGV
jgi:hypothetical protein